MGKRSHTNRGSHFGQAELAFADPDGIEATAVALPTEAHRPHFEDVRRQLGAYYTPHSVADYIADWAVRHDREHILEPSFGDGNFLRAVMASVERKSLHAVCVSGIEINEAACVQTLAHLPSGNLNLECRDFLSVTPFTVQAVIGNPPYVRLRHLAGSQKYHALQTAQSVLKQPMDPSGSLWMPFVLHAMRFLAQGGRLALVLPYELTYVRYARPLWNALAKNFGSLRVLRTHERMFPGLLQDVVILFADEYGSRANTVHYQAFEQVTEMLAARPVVDTFLNVDPIVRGERSFINALLGEPLQRLLATRIRTLTCPARDFVTFNIGYVSGDGTFFHPAQEVVEAYALPSRSLRAALTSARMIKGAGLWTSALDASRAANLYYPDNASLTEGEQRYIAVGVGKGVSLRYKCRVREPWYVVPGTRIPDVVLSVFSERPVLLVNNAQFYASNSLLCGYRVKGTSEEFATRWYTSLTLLQCELEVHALGGGVLVMVPREAGNVRLPKQICSHTDHLTVVNRLLQSGNTTEAYRQGDQNVLQEQLGLSGEEVELIRDGISKLTYWRTSARSSLQ